MQMFSKVSKDELCFGSELFYDARVLIPRTIFYCRSKEARG